MIKACFLLFVLVPFPALAQDAPKFSFSDKTVEVGAEMTRRNITFSSDCQDKIAKGTATLDSLVKFMEKQPNVKMEIAAHDGKPCKTCTGCQPSQNAANAIMNYLVKKGIKKERLSAKGYGLTQPVSTAVGDGKTRELNARKNKRIVFKVTYNKY